MRGLYCESLADYELFAVEVRAALDPSGKPPVWLGYLDKDGKFRPNPVCPENGRVVIHHPFTDGEMADLNEWDPKQCRVLDELPDGWKAKVVADALS